MAITRLVLAPVFACSRSRHPLSLRPHGARRPARGGPGEHHGREAGGRPRELAPHPRRMIWTREGDGVVDGPADTASLAHPLAMVAAGGGDLLVGDMGANAIRRYDAASRQLETIAGNDDGDARLQRRRGAVPAGALRLPDRTCTRRARRDLRQRLRQPADPRARIRRDNRSPSARSGSRPAASRRSRATERSPSFHYAPADGVDARDTRWPGPRGLAVDAAGNVFYADVDNLMVRVIWNSGPKAGKVETYAGRGWPGRLRHRSIPRATTATAGRPGT